MYYFHMCEHNTLPALCRLKQVAIELGQCSERIGRYTPSFTIIVLQLKHSVYRILHLLEHSEPPHLSHATYASVLV